MQQVELEAHKIAASTGGEIVDSFVDFL